MANYFITRKFYFKLVSINGNNIYSTKVHISCLNVDTYNHQIFQYQVEHDVMQLIPYAQHTTVNGILSK